MGGEVNGQRAYDDLPGLLADAWDDREHAQGNIVAKRIFFAAVLYQSNAETPANLEKIAEVLGEDLENIKSDYQNFLAETEKMRKARK
jgi:hypothetical protein